MAKNRDGSIDIYGSLQAKTEDGFIGYTDGIVHENEDGTKTPLDQLLKDSGGIIDVDKLPQLTGTLLVSNPDTLVEKVIFNTNLSVVETTEILRNLTYTTIPVNESISFNIYTVYSNSDMSKAITIFKLDEEEYEINFIKDISTFSYERIFKNYNQAEESAGWYKNELDINEVGITEALGAIVGNENDKLLKVISMNNDFIDDINKNVIYRLKENDENVISGYKGTAVPNSGTIESIYFNTSLNEEEVNNVLNNLSWIDASVIGQSGFEVYPVLAYMNGSYPYVLAFKKYTQNDGSYEIGDVNIAIINFANMSTITYFWGNADGGWQTFTNPYPINATLLSELSGIPMGTQNNLISSLISTKEFEIEYGAKYSYWVYKDKWLQLIDNDFLETNVIIPYDETIANINNDIIEATNNLNDKIDSRAYILNKTTIYQPNYRDVFTPSNPNNDIIFTSTEWEKMKQSDNVVLKVINTDSNLTSRYPNEEYRTYYYKKINNRANFINFIVFPAHIESSDKRSMAYIVSFQQNSNKKTFRAVNYFNYIIKGFSLEEDNSQANLKLSYFTDETQEYYRDININVKNNEITEEPQTLELVTSRAVYDTLQSAIGDINTILDEINGEEV